MSVQGNNDDDVTSIPLEERFGMYSLQELPRSSPSVKQSLISRLWKVSSERGVSNRGNRWSPYLFSSYIFRRLSSFIRGIPHFSLLRSSSDESIEIARSPEELNMNELTSRRKRMTTPSDPSKDDHAHKEEQRAHPSIFRSEPMLKCQMIMVRDAAYDCVGEIGNGSNCQFDDLNAHLSLFQRHFVREVRRCDELERSLRFLERQVSEAVPPIRLLPIDTSHLEVPHSQDLNELEATLTELERRIRELNGNNERMKQNLNHMVEVQHVLEKVDSFFAEHLEDEAVAEIEAAEDEGETPLTAMSGHFSFDRSISSRGALEEMSLAQMKNADEDKLREHTPWFVTGVISVEKKLSFERVLWRACRRTAFVRIAEIEDDFYDPIAETKTRKCVFIIFFKGDSLRKIVDNVCMGYNARQYNCPKTTTERKELLSKTVGQMTDLTTIIQTTQSHRHQILVDTALKLSEWLKALHIQKAIYHTLNKFTVDTNGFLASECWIPTSELENVRLALKRGVRKSGNEVQPIVNVIETKSVHPTYNRVNKFTRVFQEIVDSYAVANYREVNPAPFTIISFPFLFAVMFGDFAHGLILLLFALFFIRNEKRIIRKHIKDEILSTFFNGRYIILLMGLFSIYTGFIYNDAFGKAFNIFGSSWKDPYNQTQYDKWERYLIRKKRMPFAILDPKDAFDSENGPYPFGLDPVWNVADNRLTFINSMKMKTSIILGVMQMTFGIILSFCNYRFFHSTIDIVTTFIPQMIFITFIFTYLCIQIIVKWIFFSVSSAFVLGYEYPGSYCAPSLLIGLINMFMQKKPRLEGYTDDKEKIATNCYLSFWYPNQNMVELLLLCTAALCIPFMLFGKPFYLFFMKKGKGRGANSNGTSSIRRREEEEDLVPPPSTPAVSVAGDEHREDTLTDVIVHQSIHTIEFVLGCVSHTASYLRLWALSLAHAQLSEVLWHMVLMNGMSSSHSALLSPLLAYLSTFVFSLLTLSILVVMEGLSAFLHALRLHWVEFQSKFYQGGGHPFQPLSFQMSIEKAQHMSEVQEYLDID